MDALQAVQLIEEPSETKTEEQVLEAWQFLIDTGIVWQLQGAYGRMARSLIHAGLCARGRVS
jgi:hypothetical protein